MMSLFHFACLWCCWTNTLLYATTDSLFAGQYFNSSSKLCSDNRIYCLMFQVVTQYNLSGYLAIYRGNGTDWYRWVGNREQPVDIHTVRLVLSKFGKLTIESDEKVIILYEPPHPLGNGTIVAKLLNTGNFVLQSIQHTKKTTLWQSFDTPTDTMIPGMKLGKNLRAGHNWSLVSWITNWVRNPASGPYRLYWDPRDQELIISHRETIHWKSGMLRANKFEHINEVRNIEYEVVVNKDEQSFSFKTSNNEEIVWALLGNGQLMDHTTQNILADVDLCYGYNTNNGCQFYEGKPICRDEGDTFEIKYGFPSYRNVKYGPQNLTSTDCRLICWRDCDCVGFTFYNYNETGCLFFLSSKGINYVRDTGFELHMLKKNIQGHSGKGKHKWLWIRISGAAAMIFALICICIVYRVKMKNKVTGVNVNAIKVFSISSLRVATNDFSNENKLGSGGFGVVYKGTLPSGEEVAVKRLHKSAGESAIGQIKNELTLMSQVQHKNLVQVLGYCIYEQKLLLVLEFVKNTSLHTILFGDGSTEKKELVWEERYQIIEGIALGLYYLHSLYSDNKIIHRDLKPANILLDENMNPKIADFGLATLLQANEQAPLKELEGTAGYIAPEYANGAEISDKGDVYSFGVIVLQILSVQKAVVSEAYVVGATPVYRSLVQCAWELCQEGEILSLKDPLLSDLFNVEILKFLEIGLACTQKLEDRPTMATIIPLILDRNRTNLELELKNPYIWQMSSDRLIHTDNMDQESEPLLYSRTGMSFSIYRSFLRRVESKAAIERIYSL